MTSPSEKLKWPQDSQPQSPKKLIEGVIDDTPHEIEKVDQWINAGQIMEAGIENPDIYKKYLEKTWENEFKINFWWNTSVERRVWLSEIMDETVESVTVTKVNWKVLEGTRQWIKWAFYTNEWKYIAVLSGDSVKISKSRTSQELNEIKEKNSEVIQKLEGDNSIVKNFRKKYNEEYDLIIRKSLEFGIDPTFLMALRKTENWWTGKQFWVLKDDLDTFASQLIMACRIIQNNMNRYKAVTEKEPRDSSWIFSSDFLCFFSSIYAPFWVNNDPRDHLKNMLLNYSDLSGNNMGDIDSIIAGFIDKMEWWNEKMYPVSKNNPSESKNNPSESKNGHSGSTDELLSLLGWSKESIESNLQEITFVGKKVTVIRYIAKALENAERDIEQDPEASIYKIKKIGWYKWRKAQKPGWWSLGSLSKHALWIAIDINPAENPYYYNQAREYKYARCSIPPRFVEIMKENWFNWWWDWHSYNDSMHFEFSDPEKLRSSIAEENNRS
jgi:hypothetical protein